MLYVYEVGIKGIGLVREVEKLGRLVIPKELREVYCLNGRVEIVTTDEGILIRNPKFKVVRIEESNSS